MKKFLMLLMLMCFIGNSLFAQNRKISGQVLDEKSGSPIAGTSIMQSGTNRGTTTDQNGNFSLNIASAGKVTLNVSHTGYASQVISINRQTDVTISLSEVVDQLNDVVVIGYGSVKKKDLTGAVSGITSKDITLAPSPDATKALQGTVPGLIVTKNNNRPGQDYSIDIRGENTINGSTEPLYVIDGIIGATLRDINPADIQSMDVLKDASSTAIYGSRGANGVIIITTKKGSSGKPKISLSTYGGLKTIAHEPRLLNTAEYYKAFVTDAVANGGSAASFTANELANIKANKSVDWVKLLEKPAFSTGSTVAVSGGTSSTTYRISGGYIQEQGNTPYTNFTKYSVDAAITSKVNRFLKVGFTGLANYSDNPVGSYEALRIAYRLRQDGTVNYKDLADPTSGPDAGKAPWHGYAIWAGQNDVPMMNPMVESNPANTKEEEFRTNEMGSGFAELSLLKGLTFKSSVSAFIVSERYGDYRGTLSKDRNGTRAPRANYKSNTNKSYTIDNQLNYNFSSSKSVLDVIVLQEAYKFVNEDANISVQNLPYSSYWYALGTAGNSNVTGVSSDYQMNSLQSYMGRVNYTYDGKYLLTLTGRGDGASQLAPGNKWAFFPSGAFAWRLGDESFMKNSNVFSNLKLRVSYGQVGNSTVAPYSTSSSIANTNYTVGGNSVIGFYPNNLANRDLKWERSEELNFGLDFGILENRITGTVEVYNKNTKDLILQETLPTSTGFSSVFANVGSINNKGIELLLNTRNIETTNFRWTTSYNFSKNKNKVVSLANGVTSLISDNLFVGKPVRAQYDYKFAGIWQTAEAAKAAAYGALPGQVKVVDTNGDGKISSAAGIDDRQYLGTELPNYIMGMTNTFGYKNFDLTIRMYYRNGSLYRNSLYTGTMADYTDNGDNHIKLNYWTVNNPTNEMYGVGISQPSYKNAIAYQDASFLRVTDITLGYNVSRNQLNKWGLGNVYVYLQVINPFLFTKYNGLDPEYNSNTYQDQAPSITTSLGLNVTF